MIDLYYENVKFRSGASKFFTFPPFASTSLPVLFIFSYIYFNEKKPASPRIRDALVISVLQA